MRYFLSHVVCSTFIAVLLYSNVAKSDGNSELKQVTTVITESHWIGVNTEALTGNVHVGTIGANTALLTLDGATPKWIGQNTQYITDVVQTATISGALTTVTHFPNIQIIGPVDNDGVPTGSFNLLLAPAFAAQVQELVNGFCPQKIEEACSPEFLPRVQSLVKGAGSVLQERGMAENVVIGTVVFVAWAIERVSQRNRQIPPIIQVDQDFINRPTPTYATIATSYILTLTHNVKATQALDVSSPKSTLGEEEDKNDCWLYVGVSRTADDIEDSEDWEISGSTKKRSLPADEEIFNDSRGPNAGSRKSSRGIAGRISINPLHDLLKRDSKSKKKITQIGMCSSNKLIMPIEKVRPHPRPEYVMQPFSDSNVGQRHGIDPKMWWFVPKQETDDVNNPCVIAKLTKKGKRDPLSEDTTVANYPTPYDQSTESKRLTVEHIYESSTIQDFFRSVLTSPTDKKCKEFVKMFDKPDKGSAADLDPHSRFFSLWEQNSNPSPGNWAYAGSDSRINSFKGNLLNPNLHGWPNLANIADADQKWDLLFQIWNNAGLSLDFINLPEMCSYFSARNLAIHKAFNDFDAIQECEKDPKDKSVSFKWADAYKSYMTGLFATNQLLAKTRIRGIIEAIAAQKHRLVDKKGKLTKYGKAFESLKLIFPVAHFEFKTNDLLKFSEGRLGIRNESPKDVCAKVPICVVGKFVKCISVWTNRPDIPLADCPPLPIQPIECAGVNQGSPTSQPSPKETTPPVVAYCDPTKTTGYCYLAMSYRNQEAPGDRMGNHAWIYESENCDELGHSSDIKAGISITSQLPYTVDIETYENRWAEGDWGERKLFFSAVYASQRIGTFENTDCVFHDHSSNDFTHIVYRCKFHCSTKVPKN